MEPPPVTAPKRGRGRPRKNFPQFTTQVTQVDKLERGRPRKDPANPANPVLSRSGRNPLVALAELLASLQHEDIPDELLALAARDPGPFHILRPVFDFLVQDAEQEELDILRRYAAEETQARMQAKSQAQWQAWPQSPKKGWQKAQTQAQRQMQRQARLEVRFEARRRRQRAAERMRMSKDLDANHHSAPSHFTTTTTNGGSSSSSPCTDSNGSDHPSPADDFGLDYFLHCESGLDGSVTLLEAPAISTSSKHTVSSPWPKQQLDQLRTSNQNNEAGPPLLSQTMESAGIQQTPQHHRHDSPSLPVMSSGLGTPGHITDHGVPSNLRSTEDSLFDQPFPPDLDPVGANDLPLDHADLYATISNEQHHSPSVPATLEPDGTSFGLDSDIEPQPGPLAGEQSPETGYAMLCFPDSYHVLTTLNLVITRDEKFKQRAEEEKRAMKREARRRVRQEQHTQRALNDYAHEPSQPSQTGDDVNLDPSSGSAEGDGLEGRPARGLLSHYSEQGGLVAYDPPSNGNAEYFPRRIRHRIKPSSSSATSIAPQDLQCDALTLSARDAEAYTGSAAADDNGGNWAALPVHTGNPDDIKYISREHLVFSFDPEKVRWVLHVVGNNAIIDEHLYKKGDRNIPLKNGTEIFISSLRITFRLPLTMDDAESPIGSDEELGEADEMVVDVDSDHERRLSNSLEIDADPDEDAEKPERVAQKKPIKLKLKTKPKAGKGKGKDKGKEPATQTDVNSKDMEPKASDPPEPAKPAGKDKGKKPAKTTAVVGEEAGEAATTEANGSSRPANILPGSILESLAPNEMPEKRKGPGRPPKNGFLSKRDERAVMRRTKEYERRGMAVPDFNVMLAEVREEQKAKDAAAKGNKLRPDGVTDVAESIEAGDQPQDGVGGQTRPKDSHTSQSADPAAAQAGSSGLTRRPLRSPSPMKPAEEFTEEELKKPQASYFYLLDEILQAVGQADLQTIYDKFQKRWPYYKYSVSTNGWQSSIRHNLSQFSRFKAVGKVGKGQLWAIDYNAPREENTKKKKTPPPPRQPQMPMQNGSMPPSMPPHYQHSAQQYAPRYNPQTQYSSPYGSDGPHYPLPPPGVRQPGYWVNGKFIPHLMPVQPPGSAPPPPQPAQPAKPSNPVEAITIEVMQFRQVYLAKVPADAPEFTGENAKFFGAVNYFSAIFHEGTGNPDDHFPGEEALKTEPYMTVKAIFDKHMPGKSNGAANGQGQEEGQSDGTTGQTNGQGTAARQPQPGQQQGQQVPQQQNGHISGPNMAPPSHGPSSVIQGVHDGVASQNAAMAQAAAANHPAPASGPESNPQSNPHSNGQMPVQPAAMLTAPERNTPHVEQMPAQPAAISRAPESTSQPVGLMPNGLIDAAVATPGFPGPFAHEQAGTNNMLQPSVTPPVPTQEPQQQTPSAPMTAPVVDANKQPSPVVEQARPVVAGVKRDAEDAEMQDVDTGAKRLRAE